MYVKLNFTADQPLNFIFRVVNELVNNTAITSVSTLRNAANTGSWHATLLQNFDDVNSEIIRTGSGITALTSNTVSRYAKGPGTSYTDPHAWTLEFSRYDNTSLKYYVQHYGMTEINYTSSVRISNTLTSGTLSSATSMAPTAAPLSSASGTDPSFPAGSLYTAAYAAATTTSGFNNVRSFFMFLSDNCLIWAATATATYNIGFGNTYSDSTRYIGPYIYSQYNRFDWHNTNNNLITPLLFTNPSRVLGGGFGRTTDDWNAVENNQYASNTTVGAFRVYNLINAYPSTTPSFPIIPQPVVNWGVGSRYTDYAGLAAAAAPTTVSGVTYGAPISTTVSTRYPSADLKSLGYAMLPVSWRHLYYYNAGGDASARGGWYCFNGDYYPGDEFSYGGKTYKILPTWTGYSQRVGIAIPKE